MKKYTEVATEIGTSMGTIYTRISISITCKPWVWDALARMSIGWIGSAPRLVTYHDFKDLSCN